MSHLLGSLISARYTQNFTKLCDMWKYYKTMKKKLKSQISIQIFHAFCWNVGSTEKAKFHRNLPVADPTLMTAPPGCRFRSLPPGSLVSLLGDVDLFLDLWRAGLKLRGKCRFIFGVFFIVYVVLIGILKKKNRSVFSEILILTSSFGDYSHVVSSVQQYYVLNVVFFERINCLIDFSKFYQPF